MRKIFSFSAPILLVLQSISSTLAASDRENPRNDSICSYLQRAAEISNQAGDFQYDNYYESGSVEVDCPAKAYSILMKIRPHSDPRALEKQSDPHSVRSLICNHRSGYREAFLQGWTFSVTYLTSDQQTISKITVKSCI